MVPLVKNKRGELSDLHNYRAIDISSAFSKILECVINVYLRSDSDVDCMLSIWV